MSAPFGSTNLVPVDLICGGFPCQDVSPAGKGAGLAGERSGLWREFARIARATRPRWIVVVVRGLEELRYDFALEGRHG